MPSQRKSIVGEITEGVKCEKCDSPMRCLSVMTPAGPELYHKCIAADCGAEDL